MKIRRLVAELISILPVRSIRQIVYNIFLGYKIERSKIGWRTVIDVDSVTIIDAIIGRCNRFMGQSH